MLHLNSIVKRNRNSLLNKFILYFSSSSCNQFLKNPSQKLNFCPQEPSLQLSSSTYTHHHYLSLLQTCVNKRLIEPGKQIHGRIILSGLGLHDVKIATKLVCLYSACNYLSDAQLIFDKLPKRNIFLWNVLIRGYAWYGPHEIAISLYYQLLDHGLKPDNFTYPFVLKACSSLSALKDGEAIHEDVIQAGWEFDVFIGAALVDMYAKCGCVDKARSVFDRIPARDVVTWNSMLAAYSQNGCPEEALSLCREMALTKDFRSTVTVATLVAVISASADIAALLQGREIHGFSWRRGFETQDKVTTTLVDMYAKSGSLKVARRLFQQLKEKRVVPWNAIITGYAMHGHAKEALALFADMQKEGFPPDHITFVGVLSACSRGGFMDQGWKFFESMLEDYLIKPTVQHYTCMVDLLGHSGRLVEAYDLIMGMQVRADSGIWGSLLNSCRLHGNVELGEQALAKLIALQPDDAGNYVILSNIYAQAGKWDGVAKLRMLMKEKGLKKSIACSWIDVKNKTHGFLVGDVSHPQSDEIYAELKRLGCLMKEAGYVPDTTPVFHDVDDDEKMNMVYGHSERLAIAFGIISTPSGTRLLVTKNLRVCDDCHVVIKFISQISKREIIVRDVNRYHHFENGNCSCGDYW
ncbi:hypothetical protein MKW92_044791 [Papaver armeniacum]|nr:hypothetical protein MKW92_044791 [Papaver armeniacum]